MRNFYRIRVALEYPGLPMQFLEGVFVSRGHSCPAGKIKAQCASHLRRHIELDRELDPSKLELTIFHSATPYSNLFVVCEDDDKSKPITN